MRIGRADAEHVRVVHCAGDARGQLDLSAHDGLDDVRGILYDPLLVQGADDLRELLIDSRSIRRTPSWSSLYVVARDRIHRRIRCTERGVEIEENAVSDRVLAYGLKPNGSAARVALHFDAHGRSCRVEQWNEAVEPLLAVALIGSDVDGCDVIACLSYAFGVTAR